MNRQQTTEANNTRDFEESMELLKEAHVKIFMDRGFTYVEVDKEKLDRIMKQKGITVSEIAKQCGRSSGWLFRLKWTNNLLAYSIAPICRVLDIDVREIIPENTIETPENTIGGPEDKSISFCEYKRLSDKLDKTMQKLGIMYDSMELKLKELDLKIDSIEEKISTPDTIKIQCSRPISVQPDYNRTTKPDIKPLRRDVTEKVSGINI